MYIHVQYNNNNNNDNNNNNNNNNHNNNHNNNNTALYSSMKSEDTEVLKLGLHFPCVNQSPDVCVNTDWTSKSNYCMTLTYTAIL